jgi:aminoglycoside phosphotransferase (APT) family kinase protein
LERRNQAGELMKRATQDDSSNMGTTLKEPVSPRDWKRLGEALGVDRLDVMGSPTAGGWSGDTVMLRADGRRLVARFNPVRDPLLPTSDLGLQVACMRAARVAGLPVPEVVFDDTSGVHVGVPVFVMDFVAGVTPRDFPPNFAVAGPVFEATPELRRRYYEDLLDRVVQLQRVPPPVSLTVGPDLSSHVDHLEKLGEGGSGSPVLAEMVGELRRRIPRADTPTGLIWGDARPANTVIAPDFTVAAMLDWELAAIGPGEMDVAWLWETNVLRGNLADANGALLPGFRDREGTWEYWASVSGREPIATAWHHLYAAHRVALIVDLTLAAQVRRGELATDHKLIRDNRSLRRLMALAAE